MVLHILRDCVYAKEVWLELLHPDSTQAFFSSNLRDWGKLNLRRDLGMLKNGHWQKIWGVSIWKLWLWRNEAIFSEDFVKPCRPAMVIMNCWKSFVQIQDCGTELLDAAIGILKWRPPDINWVKVNVDGAVSKYADRAACGVIIRNHEGLWVAGLSHFLGNCSVLDAEKWAIVKGLSLAWDLGFRKVVLESDAKIITELLSQDSGASSGNMLLWRINEFKQRNWLLHINHISRDRNNCADALAKEGLSSSRFFDGCPAFCQDELHRD